MYSIIIIDTHCVNSHGGGWVLIPAYASISTSFITYSMILQKEPSVLLRMKWKALWVQNKALQPCIKTNRGKWWCKIPVNGIYGVKTHDFFLLKKRNKVVTVIILITLINTKQSECSNSNYPLCKKRYKFIFWMASWNHCLCIFSQ